MLLKLKGMLRRAKASIDGLSPVSTGALWGVLGLCALVCALCLITCARTTPFEVDDEDAIPDAYADEGSPETEVPSLVVVHIGGCVMSPGVYALPEGSRVSDGVLAAGGFSAEANPEGVNLARLIHDGEHVVIPALGSPGDDSAQPGSMLVSINTATLEELQSLDGIGEVLAKRILAYRTRIGGFTSLTQLMEVSGIGSRKYEAIKDDICL